MTVTATIRLTVPMNECPDDPEPEILLRDIIAEMADELVQDGTLQKAARNRSLMINHPILHEGKAIGGAVYIFDA